MAGSSFKIIVVMYATAIGTLWASARMLGPAGYHVSLPRPALAAVLMTISSKLLRIILSPLIGDWYSLVLLPVYVLLVKGVLLLPFWRSVLIAVIYIGVVAAVYYFLSPTP
jgi:hypothetical protein